MSRMCAPLPVPRAERTERVEDWGLAEDIDSELWHSFGNCWHFGRAQCSAHPFSKSIIDPMIDITQRTKIFNNRLMSANYWQNMLFGTKSKSVNKYLWNKNKKIVRKVRIKIIVNQQICEKRIYERFDWTTPLKMAWKIAGIWKEKI